MPRIDDWLPEQQKVIKNAEALIQQGIDVYFKYTCAKCGERCTFEEMGHLYKQGRCEACGHLTNTDSAEAKLNFMAVAKGDTAMKYLADVLGGLGRKET